MALVEDKALQGVRLDMETGEVIASWITTYTNNGEVLTRRLDHIHYTQEQKAQMESEVPDGANYSAAMGW